MFPWADAALQQMRDQRVTPPHAACNFGLPTASGFLAANSTALACGEPFGIGAGRAATTAVSSETPP